MNWTIYSNTTIHGLLSDEQRAAIEGHAGPWEYWSGGWRDIAAPRWDPKKVYRAKH